MQVTTQSDLVYDVEDGLKEYYEKKAELEKQIEIFREAIETAQDDLKNLDKQYKTQLRTVGKKKKKQFEVISEFVQDNTNVRFIILQKYLMNNLHIGEGVASNIIRQALNANVIYSKEGFYYKNINSIQRATGIKSKILELLRNEFLSIKEIHARLPKYSLHQITSNINQLSNRKFVVRCTNNNEKIGRYKIRDAVPPIVKENVDDMRPV